MHNLVSENIVVNAQADAFAKLCNEGYIRIKTSKDILLAELTLGNPAFNPPVKGILTAKKITPEYSAKNSGKAYKYEIYKKDGVTKLITGTVGKLNKGFDLELSSVDITEGSQINIISYNHIIPKENNANNT